MERQAWSEAACRATRHYQIELTQDANGTQVSAIKWTKRIEPGSAVNPWKTDPGVYCLRATLVEQDNARLWRTVTMLTNLESVFRSLKTDLGLRPVFDPIERRVEGICSSACWPTALCTRRARRWPRSSV